MGTLKILQWSEIANRRLNNHHHEKIINLTKQPPTHPQHTHTNIHARIPAPHKCMHARTHAHVHKQIAEIVLVNTQWDSRQCY